MRAGFAHYKGDGEWVFINDKMRDMLAEFANAIAEHSENAQREEDAALIEPNTDRSDWTPLAEYAAHLAARIRNA